MGSMIKMTWKVHNTAGFQRSQKTRPGVLALTPKRGEGLLTAWRKPMEWVLLSCCAPGAMPRLRVGTSAKLRQNVVTANLSATITSLRRQEWTPESLSTIQRTGTGPFVDVLVLFPAAVSVQKRTGKKGQAHIRPIPIPNVTGVCYPALDDSEKLAEGPRTACSRRPESWTEAVPHHRRLRSISDWRCSTAPGRSAATVRR